MENSLLFDFAIDKSTNSVFVTREFNAGISLVWDAFTQQEILDQWWAPKPWISRTKIMEFKEGGRRFYAMVSPEGAEHWSLQLFSAITPVSHFRMESVFTDQDENRNPDMPGSIWDLHFSEENGITKVHITIVHKTLANLEKLIEMGFQGGFTMTLNFLETLLAGLSKH